MSVARWRPRVVSRDRRGRVSRQPNRTVLIATNGKVTERSYLNGLKQQFHRPGLRIKIEYVPGEPDWMLRKLQSPKGDTGAYDEVWLVVDEDGKDRSEFVNACRRLSSRKQQWHAIVSRPCFEVWLVAHYEQLKPYSDQSAAQHHYSSVIPDGVDPKTLPHDFPWHSVEEASRRCTSTKADSLALNELPPSPGSAMPLLVEALRRAQ